MICREVVGCQQNLGSTLMFARRQKGIDIDTDTDTESHKVR